MESGRLRRIRPRLGRFRSWLMQSRRLDANARQNALQHAYDLSDIRPKLDRTHADMVRNAIAARGDITTEAAAVIELLWIERVGRGYDKDGCKADGVP